MEKYSLLESRYRFSLYKCANHQKFIFKNYQDPSTLPQSPLVIAGKELGNNCEYYIFYFNIYSNLPINSHSRGGGGIMALRIWIVILEYEISFCK